VEKTLYIKARPEMEIPGIFTPNGDGKNERFVIKGLGEVAEYYLAIQAPDGEKVFETRDPDEFWNGTLYNKGSACEADRYRYILEYRYPAQEQSRNKMGTILLKRSK